MNYFSIFPGKDLEPGCEGGTWLAVSPIRKKLGLLLNLPGVKKENAKSGHILHFYFYSWLFSCRSLLNVMSEMRSVFNMSSIGYNIS